MGKKEDVISAARSLFKTYGYKKVSMDEIADKSNVTKKTIYTYFKDKNELVKFFLYEELEKMKKIVNKISQEDISFDFKIHKIIFELLEYRKKDKMLQNFALEADKTSGTLANECLEIINKTIIEEVKMLLEKAIEEGYIKNCDTDLTAFIIYKIYVALIFEWNKPINQDEVTERFTKLLKYGLFS